MALLTKRRWLEEGRAVLEEAGAEALTIESLTSRLVVTKGSFYHDFANYQDFKERLLEFWEQEGTIASSNGQNSGFTTRQVGLGDASELAPPQARYCSACLGITRRTDARSPAGAVIARSGGLCHYGRSSLRKASC